VSGSYHADANPEKEFSMNNQNMPKRRLGKSSLRVAEIGLGCMGMSYAYGSTDDAESMRVLHRYVELGGDFLDTAEIYGPYTNEELLGRFLKETDREKLVIATKFGFKIDPKTRTIVGADSSPENIHRACEGSLKRLGIETIDLYYQHRVDPARPIEETVGVMAELVEEGKIRELGDEIHTCGFWRTVQGPRIPRHPPLGLGSSFVVGDYSFGV